MTEAFQEFVQWLESEAPAEFEISRISLVDEGRGLWDVYVDLIHDRRIGLVLTYISGDDAVGVMTGAESFYASRQQILEELQSMVR